MTSWRPAIRSQRIWRREAPPPFQKYSPSYPSSNRVRNIDGNSSQQFCVALNKRFLKLLATAEEAISRRFLGLDAGQEYPSKEGVFHALESCWPQSAGKRNCTLFVIFVTLFSLVGRILLRWAVASLSSRQTGRC
jgi:hypothetical protein